MPTITLLVGTRAQGITEDFAFRCMRVLPTLQNGQQKFISQFNFFLTKATNHDNFSRANQTQRNR